MSTLSGLRHRLNLPVVVAALLPLVVWAYLCIERPWRLGFYSDDWMVILHPHVGSLEAFTDVFKLVTTRPFSVPWIWALQVLADWSPVRAQLVNIAALALTAGSLGFMVYRMASAMGVSPYARLIAAAFAAACFISLPSNVGIFAWGIGMIAVTPAMVPFCIGVGLLIRHEDRSSRQVAAGLALLLVSHLSYEVFYFQEVIILGAAFVLSGRSLTREDIKLLAAIMLVNIACILFNRLLPGNIHKPFNPAWIATFWGGYGRIDHIFIHAAREYMDYIKPSLVMSGVLGFFCLFRVSGLLAALVAMALFCAGIVAGGVLYAFAGYGLAAEGVMARTSILIAIYFSVACGLFAAAAWQQTGLMAWLRAIWIIYALSLIISMALVSKVRLEEWASVWSQEKERFSSLPAGYSPVSGDTKGYVVVNVKATTFVHVASAPWEMQGAVAWGLSTRSGVVGRGMTRLLWQKEMVTHWYSTLPQWFNRWNGTVFEQGPCASKSTVYSGQFNEMWVWNPQEKTFAAAAPGWAVGCTP
jgi:hypothetical protein